MDTSELIAIYRRDPKFQKLAAEIKELEQKRNELGKRLRAEFPLHERDVVWTVNALGDLSFGFLMSNI